MRRSTTTCMLRLLTFLMLGCSATRPRLAPEQTPSLIGANKGELEDRSQVGEASYYGPGFHGRRTASGEAYDERAMTAAHPTLGLGTRVRVINLDNLKSAVVTINDRGPYVRGRIIDVSRRAARALGFVRDGVTRVRVVPLA